MAGSNGHENMTMHRLCLWQYSEASFCCFVKYQWEKNKHEKTSYGKALHVAETEEKNNKDESYTFSP